MTTLHVECPACGQSVQIVAAFDPPGYLTNHLETLTWSSVPYWVDDTRATFTMSARVCEGSGRAVDREAP